MWHGGDKLCQAGDDRLRWQSPQATISNSVTFLLSKNAINWLRDSFDNRTLVIIGLYNAGQLGLLIVAYNRILVIVFEKI